MKRLAPEQVAVDRRGARKRLDRYLAQLERWGSRARVQRLILEGGVRVDGKLGEPDTILGRGQIVEVAATATELRSSVEPEPIPLDIIFEDQCLLVINKPPGMVVHPAPGHWSGTLVAALLHHFGKSPSDLDPLRPGIVHRLDKDTSGALVVVKDACSLENVAKQFRDRKVNKQYVAAVHGRMRQRSGCIDQPIGRNPVHRNRMAVVASGRSATTSFEVVGGFEDITLVRLFPTTGRTHQLRVHLAAIGHPIVGDTVYGRGRRSGSDNVIKRQALHAERIALLHPSTGKRVEFVAALADDLRPLWQRAAIVA